MPIPGWGCPIKGKSNKTKNSFVILIPNEFILKPVAACGTVDTLCIRDFNIQAITFLPGNALSVSFCLLIFLPRPLHFALVYRQQTTKLWLGMPMESTKIWDR